MGMAKGPLMRVALADAPITMGHEWNAVELEAFKRLTLGDEQNEICKDLHINKGTLIYWRSQPWWRKMHEQWVQGELDDLHRQLLERKPEYIKAFDEVMRGVDKEDRTASARIAGFRALMESGENPIIRKRNHLQVGVQVNTQINNFAILSDEQLRGMSQEELIELNTTGRVPKRMEG